MRKYRRFNDNNIITTNRNLEIQNVQHSYIKKIKTTWCAQLHCLMYC
jgi:hypothetical protein